MMSKIHLGERFGRTTTIAFPLVAILLAAILALPLACGKKEAGEIRIGAVLPLTGEIAEYGTRCKAGIDLALDEINGSGGIKGNKLALVYEDSRGNPADGVSALRKLITVDRVRFVIGAVASSVTLAMEPVATENKVILFSPASSSPKLTGISRYFFRDWPSDVFEATVLAEFVHSELKTSRVAILYVNNDYGIGLTSEFTRRFTELGGEVPVSETYEQGATDFRSQLSKIKAAAPNAVYLAGYHREMAFATKQIRELGIDAQILGDADYGVEELLGIAGDAAEGAIYSIPEYDPEAGAEAAKAFAESFRSIYNKEPSIFEANGFDALKIIAVAIESVGTNTDSVSTRIAALQDYQGASGNISFDERREVVKPITIKTVKNNEFVIYK